MLLLSILPALAHDHHRQSESHQVPSIVVTRGSLTPLTSFTPFPLRELGHPFIIHRIVRDSCPCERHKQLAEPEDTSRENKTTGAESWGWLVAKTLMLFVLVGLAGAAGFYFGKVNESRNYVRVPSVN